MILFNGKLQDEPLNCSPFSLHFQYGTGFFETILYNKGLFFYEEHLKRMRNTCKDFCIDLNWDDISEDKLVRLLGKKKDSEFRLKILYAPLKEDSSRWDTVVTMQPYKRRDNPMTAALHCTEPYNNSLHHYKSTNYEYHRYWCSHYKNRGMDEVLFSPDGKRALEGSYTNIIVRKGKTLYFAPPTLPCLPGIAQEKILEWANKSGYKLKPVKKGFTHAQLRSGEEVILTNSLLLAENLISLKIKEKIYTLGQEKILRNAIRENFLNSRGI
ncbi:MAG: aminotransferase class IV [Spirochaetales bacterium]|nr:aminotransferase class IV [Spirochaetales bacterium]